MDTTRIDKLMQYALAVAGESEEWKDRQLGPIHLIKYVYLADLAYAEREGETFTGAPWQFYKFGPYCTPVWERVEPAMAAIAAEDRAFESDQRDELVPRWKSQDPEHDRDRAGAGMPVTVKSAINRAVRAWGSDTQGLLDFVYKTEPMLRAAPGESLVFERSVRPGAFAPEGPQTRKQEKKTATKVELLRAKIEKRRAAQEPRRNKPMRLPRYDDVYAEGVECLDRLAGGPVLGQRGVVEIDASVWRSETRGRREDP